MIAGLDLLLDVGKVVVFAWVSDRGACKASGSHHTSEFGKVNHIAKDENRLVAYERMKLLVNKES